MNENLANEIRKTIESVKDMKIQVGGINNYLSILEGMIRADYQKQVDEAYQRGYNKGYADKKADDEIKVEIPAEPKVEINFDLLRLACKHFTVSYDSYASQMELACHHTENIPQGDSWGVCSQENCPFLKRERGEV